jgi:SEFIR domain
MKIKHKYTGQVIGATYNYWKENILSRHVEKNYEILSHPDLVDVFEINPKNGKLKYVTTTDRNFAINSYLTVDAKYTLEETKLKFDEYYRPIKRKLEEQIIDTLFPSLKFDEVNNKMKELFITYSWDNEEHIEKVVSFTNHLRDEGFDAEMDKLHTQNETATDFYKMMHQAMTNYEKVIVVLSKGYKEKAENFKGGVGNEYNLILKDIETQNNKYILVSFEPINDEITPLNFKGRHIFDLSNKKNLNELYAKLQNVKTIEFSEVGTKKPIIEKTVIPKFAIQEQNLEVGNLNCSVDNSSQFAQLFTKIEFDLNLEIVNNSKETFSDYSIEAFYPVNSTNFDTNGRIEKNYKIITYENNPKLFPTQTRSIKLESLIVRNNNADEIIASNLLVKIFTDKGVSEKEFPLKEVLIIRSIYGDKKITLDQFHDKNYR